MSLFQNSHSSIPALSQHSVSDKQYYCYISGLLLYDDIFPSQLKGKGPDGSEITLHACPELGAEVIEQEFFDPNEVRQIIHFVDIIFESGYDATADSLLLLHFKPGVGQDLHNSRPSFWRIHSNFE